MEVPPEVEAIARLLDAEAQARIDKRRGFTEVDDFAKAIGWLDYREEATRLHQQGAIIVRGKLVI